MPTLNWIGKEAVVNHHRRVPFRLLRDVGSLSFGDPGSGNLIVQGDNLLALKALLPYYAGEVKCVYIDPPYNTGNEGWRYNDNVSSPIIRQWLGEVVKKEDETLDRHDRWLCMMYPRLTLLRSFLRQDGVIFISIDGNEAANLEILMDEIFGRHNSIAVLPTIMNLKGNQDEFGFAGTHEYVVCYARNKARCTFYPLPLEDEETDEWLEDEYGPYKRGANLKATGQDGPREKRPTMFYPIWVSPDNSVSVEKKSDMDVRILPNTDGKEMRWRWQSKKVLREPHNIIVVRDGEAISLYKKQRPEIGELPSKKPKSVLYKPEYSSGNGTNELKDIFGKKVFETPKPIALIEDLIRIGSRPGDLILDSFAGAGTTGHAVLGLNAEGGIPRRFVLVEMDADIARETTAVRVGRAAGGFKSSKRGDVPGLGGSFRFCELGDQLFDENGKIRPSVTFAELARHVYFTETGEPLPKERVGKSPLLGEFRGVGIYLLYNGILGDKSAAGGNILTRQVLAGLPPFRGQKVVYCAGNLIGKERLEAERIDVRQTPYEIRVT